MRSLTEHGQVCAHPFNALLYDCVYTLQGFTLPLSEEGIVIENESINLQPQFPCIAKYKKIEIGEVKWNLFIGLARTQEDSSSTFSKKLLLYSKGEPKAEDVVQLVAQH